MGPSRVFRIIEGAFITLFFVQAVRVVLAILASMLSTAVSAHRVSLETVTAHLVLLAMLVVPWLAPHARTRLPRLLLITAVGATLARLGLSVQSDVMRLYSGLAVIGLTGVYYTTLLRANWRAWVPSFIVGLGLEQLLRARDTYDLLLRMVTDVPVGDLRLRMPVFVIQAMVAGLVIITSVIARRSTRQEPYQPAHVTILGGVSLGCFLALEVLLLGMPNVIARWAGVPFSALAAWSLLATIAPLMPSLRVIIGETLTIFDERLRGWVWLFLLLLMMVVGERVTGFGSAAALMVAQFMAVMLLWWVPSPPDPEEVEQVGPSVSLALLTLMVLIYAHLLTYLDIRSLDFMHGQGLPILLAAGGLLGLQRVRWREKDPWLQPVMLPTGLMAAVVMPAAVFGLILSGIGGQTVTPPMGDKVRVATYNINGGYDDEGRLQVELIAKTLEASLADIITLQEVDTGRPFSQGIDEVEYLARALGMQHAYFPTSQHLYGVAILSRWPIVQQAGSVLSTSGEHTGAVTARIVDPTTGRSISVIGTQFPERDEQSRVQHLAGVFSLVDQAAPTVLGVDLRAGPDDFIYQQLTGGSFADPDRLLGIEQGYTYPADEPTVRTDYVLVRGLVPNDVWQVALAASDHRLVVVEVSWP